MRILPLVALVLLPSVGRSGAYEIGEDAETESFWKSDPVLFVQKHVKNGFQFTSNAREGADSRLDGGVTYYGEAVFESRLYFGEAGGVERVELTLFAPAGTETYQELTDDSGRQFRRRVRVDKTITKTEYEQLLQKLRGKLTKNGAKPPKPTMERTSSSSVFQFSQIWPKTEVPTQTSVVWNYSQNSKNDATFVPGFIRVVVNGPARLSSKGTTAKGEALKGARKIVDNVVRDVRGDVFIDNMPMVDQGQKGYCAVATAERVLRYYGVEIDEHELALAAGTDAEGGTSTLAMKNSVEAIGKRYRLGTVVCYGDFDKSSAESIAGMIDEVKAYNKAARKLKKPEIAPDAYIRHEDGKTYYSKDALGDAMDAEVQKEMKVNGVQKAKYTRFLRDVHEQVAKGIPLFWGVRLAVYPEQGIPQTAGNHMRLIIGYNDKKKEILYTDSWGAGHELKRMPADWAWTISHCLMYLKPLMR